MTPLYNQSYFPINLPASVSNLLNKPLSLFKRIPVLSNKIISKRVVTGFEIIVLLSIILIIIFYKKISPKVENFFTVLKKKLTKKRYISVFAFLGYELRDVLRKALKEYIDEKKKKESKVPSLKDLATAVHGANKNSSQISQNPQ